MTTSVGQMKECLRERVKIILLSWFVFEQKLMMFSIDSSNMLRRMHHYTSKTIQNEFVGIIGSRIRSDILKRAKFFSVIAGEVTNIVNIEQLSMSLTIVSRKRSLNLCQLKG